MVKVDIELVCQICGWKATGTVKASQENIFAEVLNFVRQQTATHSHGIAGNWQVKYGPK